ncbi:hypothetical protein KC906_02965 [Candidatus Kaiserbacteria bacterium]|nr:hypothetical protein [Candidatus Kaiserbacteria bacterium]
MHTHRDPLSILFLLISTHTLPIFMIGIVIAAGLADQIGQVWSEKLIQLFCCCMLADTFLLILALPIEHRAKTRRHLKIQQDQAGIFTEILQRDQQNHAD